MVSEVSGAEKVAFLRSEMENFVGLSFATIRLFHVVARKYVVKTKQIFIRASYLFFSVSEFKHSI